MTPEELETLITARRSNLLIDASREIDSSIVERIVNTAQWAPNHKRTWPLRAAVISGDSRRVLGDTIADAMAAHGDDDIKVLKTRGKFMRSPIVIVVAAAKGDTSNETEENKYAVAAGVQNMLLMAESFGLAALWGSPAKGANDAITALCLMESTDHVMGIIYLGWPTQSVRIPERPGNQVTYLS
ncbi:MAG: nitroreductase family protein [Actinobacteria bacterium]|nr:nitroreductase family protein [Actinomycetota bacterium]